MKKKLKQCCQQDSHFGTVMVLDKEEKNHFFLSFRASRNVKRPSYEWMESPVEQRWIIICFIAVLASSLVQFGMYNVFKDDGHGLDVLEELENGGVKLHKVLPKHAFILRALYLYINEMKYWNNSNPLPAIDRVHRMYEENDSPNYQCLPYTKGFIGIRVQNVANYKSMIEILDRNWMEVEYRVQDYECRWRKD